MMKLFQVELQQARILVDTAETPSCSVLFLAVSLPRIVENYLNHNIVEQFSTTNQLKQF